MVDDALDTLGLSRNVQYKVANFASALYIVESSDGILTAPRKFIEMMADKFAISAFEPPVELEGYSMKLYWHVKNKDDQASLWLRNTLAEVMG